MSAEATEASSILDSLDDAARIAACEDPVALAAALLAAAGSSGGLAVCVLRGETVLARAPDAEPREPEPASITLERAAGTPAVRVTLRLDAARAPAARPVLEKLLALSASVAAGLARAREWERLATDRRDLLALVSHDLRTPLQSLGLGLDAVQMQIEGTAAAASASNTLARMRRAVASAGQLLGDLLDVTRIQNGGLSVQMRTCDLREVLDELAAQHGPLFAARGLSLVVREPEVRSAICDASRLSQALSQLLSNAAKHATRGPIELRAVRAGEGARIEVADAGPGIPAEVRGRLFDGLFHTPPQPGRRGGLGLGLYLAKGIAAAHGGRIGVVSEPGSGSTFYIELDAAPAIGG